MSKFPVVTQSHCLEKINCQQRLTQKSICCSVHVASSVLSQYHAPLMVLSDFQSCQGLCVQGIATSRLHSKKFFMHIKTENVETDVEISSDRVGLFKNNVE